MFYKNAVPFDVNVTLEYYGSVSVRRQITLVFGLRS